MLFINLPEREKLPPMKHFPNFCVFIDEAKLSYMPRTDTVMMTFTKQSPLLEDLRSHSPEQLAELRALLEAGAPSRPDPRRPGFYEVEGETRIFYVFRYPTGTKILLIGVWERDLIAEMASSSCSAAA